jgi:NAD(P)-dependent dehydrogenase (short-subunit alcohol dehydrogenase family)/rhamnose utilization protein RhaD (predicted bifunctional aldolase and dehydrogenase)
MDKALLDLIKISNETGRDVSLVQGGGGNTSVKTADGKYMYIKASGTALKDMNHARGWRRMRLDNVRRIISDPELARLKVNAREIEVVNRLLLACDDAVADGARPSVEAHLHAMLDKCVIHLHPLALGAYVNAKGGRAQLEKLFAGSRRPPLWVPYADPGFSLARLIARLVADYKAEYKAMPSLLFLEKHGLFVTGPDADSALKLVHKVINTLKKDLKPSSAKNAKVRVPENISSAQYAIRKAVLAATGEYMPVSFFTNETIQAFIRQPEKAKRLLNGFLNPDELVYSNGAPLFVDRLDSDRISQKLKKQIAAGLKPSAAFIMPGLGLFVSADVKTARIINDIATGSLFVRMHAAGMGGVHTLTSREVRFINAWESEAFRKSLAAGSCKGDIAGRICIVTGAGSGLGRSIAIGLARAGGLVALADIDVAAAEETAGMIKSQLPSAAVMPVRCNVTGEQDVDTALKQVVAAWGGLDLCVNAAGIAPAYPLVNTPADKWRLAIEINLTGYFLVSRAAARIMINQGMGGSIVCVSSKSGLDASKNNTAYNATKAGELHMARGWALELGEYGIRVNCVAPGNVFEGSKIWNLEYIKVCARKYGIKPEEVIPYYVNKTALRREIKGQDIADAVVFLASDRARTITGQTIVADSGQAMVR